MTEQQTQALETTLVEDVEVEETEANIVEELVNVAFEDAQTITAYKIHSIINAVFVAKGIDKVIPPQMMYNYARNGLINKVKGQKQYNKDEVTKFVQKYTDKYSK